MRNYLIVHGHFYQPPREDPWIGEVPFQESAAPYHDWNSKITKECYAANAASRVLNDKGLITQIVNNYEYMSFNFGPTLLSWLSKKAPNVYRRIIEADERSKRLRGGHGNAIAQSYNHTILPLMDREDMRTQILWGLRDFRSHFGREAEGMWLPETGINDQVADMLIEYGMRFVILSPWQAEACRPNGEEVWTELNGAPIDTSHPYLIQRPSGSIAAFFYNHTLASGISFEHYLTNADELYIRIMNYYKEEEAGNLIHIATDGEVYGHHEPFGDMCFAALMNILNTQEELEVINYGMYLDLFPACGEVRLRAGAKGLGTSWSCTHGVLRWMEDCGCSTGGQPSWNQSWRSPLRQAFSTLKGELDAAFDRELKNLTPLPPLEARNLYIDVLTGLTGRDEFAARLLGVPASTELRKKLFLLLESQKYGQFMFTSCGWFFAEVTGIEPVQNMLYAYKALSLCEDYLSPGFKASFLKELEEAKSNIRELKNARLALLSALPRMQGSIMAGAVFILRELLRNSRESNKEYGFYRINAISIERNGEPGTFTGIVSFKDSLLETECAYEFILKENEGDGMTTRFRPYGSGKSFDDISLSSFPAELRTEIAARLHASVETACTVNMPKIFDRVKRTIIYSQNMGIPVSGIIKKTAEVSIYGLLERYGKGQDKHLTANDLEHLEEVLLFANQYGIAFDGREFKNRMASYLAEEIEGITEKIEAERVSHALTLLKVLRKGGIELELTYPQAHIYGLLYAILEPCLIDIQNGFLESFIRIKSIIRLCDAIGIDTEEVKKKLLQ